MHMCLRIQYTQWSGSGGKLLVRVWPPPRRCQWGGYIPQKRGCAGLGRWPKLTGWPIDLTNDHRRRRRCSYSLSQRVHIIVCCSVQRADVCGRPLYIYTFSTPLAPVPERRTHPSGKQKHYPTGFFTVCSPIFIYIYIVYGECPLDAFKVFTSVFVGVRVWMVYTSIRVGLWSGVEQRYVYARCGI
jgi:hypothetical protein